MIKTPKRMNFIQNIYNFKAKKQTKKYNKIIRYFFGFKVGIFNI